MLIFETGDYIAHIDSEIALVWRRNYEILVYSIDTGLQIDRIYDPYIEDLDSVDYLAAEYIETYYAEARPW